MTTNGKPNIKISILDTGRSINNPNHSIMVESSTPCDHSPRKRLKTIPWQTDNASFHESPAKINRPNECYKNTIITIKKCTRIDSSANAVPSNLKKISLFVPSKKNCASVGQNSSKFIQSPICDAQIAPTSSGPLSTCVSESLPGKMTTRPSSSSVTSIVLLVPANNAQSTSNSDINNSNISAANTSGSYDGEKKMDNRILASNFVSFACYKTFLLVIVTFLLIFILN